MAVEGPVIDALGLEEDDRVIILDRRDQQPLGVIGSGRDHRLDAGHMREDALGTLAVRLPAENAAAKGRADRHRRYELARRPIAQPRRLAHQLVERGIDIVGELNLGHGPEAIGAHAHRHADDPAFGDRRVEHTVLAIFLLQARGGAEHAAEIADILAHHDDVGIAIHHHVQRAVDRLDHVHLLRVGRGFDHIISHDANPLHSSCQRRLASQLSC